MLRPKSALAVCALALLVAALAAQAAGGPPAFPKRIGALNLARVVTQQQAQRQLNSIHDEPIPVASAAIAYYEGQGSEGAVVWWSRAASAAQAKGQLERMVAKIRRGSSFPYSGWRQLERGGLTVHSFVGRGQVHYTWCRGDEVYWLSAPPTLIDAVCEAVMK